MLRGSSRHKRFLANRARRLMRNRLHFKKVHSLRMVLKAEHQSFVSVSRPFKGARQKRVISMSVPHRFELLTNYNEVLGFFNSLLDAKLDRKLKQIKLDLSQVSSLDSSALCLLLSVINELSYSRIKVTGNYPDDTDCAKMFIESGFLQYMRDDHGNRFDIDTPNFIKEAGKAQTKNKNISDAVRKAVGFITGSDDRYQPAYTVSMELCTNSVEHAYEKRPIHWLLSVHKVNDGTVGFTMADTGVGILKTLKRKFKHEIEDRFHFRKSKDILYRAFLRKYGSSTEMVNRNKGLPCVLDKYQNGLIKSLKVITNDVYLDFDNKDSDLYMQYSFPGVLFYWEIDCSCLDKHNNVAI